MILEGSKIIRAAFDADVEVMTLYAAPGADPLLADEAAARGVTMVQLEYAELEKLTTTTTPQPELAVAQRPRWTVEALTGDLVVVGVDIQDPGNAGTVVRSALAAGASGVVFCGDSVDPFSPKTVRASAGAVLALPVVEAEDPGELLESLRGLGLHLNATASAGASDLYDTDLRRPAAIILGNEANGLDSGIVDRCDSVLSIPMTAGESLNVGVAAAVILFEAVRQRRTGR